MKSLQNVVFTPHMMISLKDVEVIFLKIPDFYENHCQFSKRLTPKVENWSDDEKIGDILKELVSYCFIK